MKHILPIAFLCLILLGGCANNRWHKNPLTNLTDKQADWFDRTSEGWLFEDHGQDVEPTDGSSNSNGSASR